jgi:hypothetical protein
LRWQAFKILLWEKCRLQKEKIFLDTKFISGEENFKGLSPPTTPFGERNFIGIVGSRIPKATVLSISKTRL